MIPGLLGGQRSKVKAGKFEMASMEEKHVAVSSQVHVASRSPFETLSRQEGVYMYFQ